VLGTGTYEVNTDTYGFTGYPVRA